MRVTYNIKNPVFTTVNPLLVGVSFAETPGGNVTVNVTGSLIEAVEEELTPTQCVDGYCFKIFANTVNAGRKYVTITFSASGYDDVQIIGWVSENTEEVNRKWTPYLYLMDGYANWRREYPNFDTTTFAAKKQALKDSLFNDVIGYPIGGPNTITNSITAFNGVTFNTSSPIRRRLTFVENDIDGYTWTMPSCWVTNEAESDVLVIDFFGHGEVGHQDFYDAMEAEGFDYAAGLMPFIPDTNNPNITGTFGGHNSYLTALDREGYDARRLFFFDKIRLLDYILSQKSYSKIVLCGVSGGGYMASQLSAFYDGLTHVFIQRGTNSTGLFESEPHYEEGSNRSVDYTNEGNVGPRVLAKLNQHTRLHWPVMAVANGAEVHHMTHPNDTVANYRSWNPEVYGKDLTDYCLNIFGGSFSQFFNTEAGETTHGWQPTDIEYIIDNI